jgi:hypothetical protein
MVEMMFMTFKPESQKVMQISHSPLGMSSLEEARYYHAREVRGKVLK